MSLDLSQFLQSFFEECIESLDSMENMLLNLEASSDKTDAINTIFRGAHSIKGASATFGFTDVSSFTHIMETLLDKVREGTKIITHDDVDLLLTSVDCVRGMLTARQNNSTADVARAEELQIKLKAALNDQPIAAVVAAAPPPKANPEVINDDEFEALLDNLHGKGGAPGVSSPAAPAAAAKPAASGEITDDEFESLLDNLHGKGGAPGASQGMADWHIDFHPHPKLMQKGSDPLRIVRVLEALGTLRVTVDDSAIPALAQLNPQECYLRWKLELSTGASRDQIEEAFAWAKGDADIKIVCLTSKLVAKAAPAVQAAAAPVPTPPVETKSPEEPHVMTAPPTPAARTAPAVAAAATTTAQEGTSIRVGIDKVDALINMVGELVITQSMLSQQSKRLELHRHPKLIDGLAQLERNTRELQESVMRIRMLPISFAFNRFPRIVRDLSQQLGKKIELKMTGETTELDKTVMEKIGDPLVHLVRNSLDHGLEKPEVRRAAGKPETGTLHLNAYHQSGNIVIEIIDDGAGLPKDKILKKARERGLIGDERSLSDEKIYELIFMPGFSTAEKVTDVSGRGVGMDVVRKNIKGLGGTVEIASKEGKGTTITIRLPLTLAILDGQSVRIGDENYIIPLVSIVESIKIRQDMINIVAGKAEIIRLRNEYMPVLRLYQIFGTEPRTTDLLEGLLVVVEGEGMKTGLFVDELLGQQQVVIKSLETNFKRVDSISGATILGDGTVALILDIPGLITLARQKIDPAEIERLHQDDSIKQGEHLAA
jgi:two-component system chemotaxis sensor kinase CheA